MYKMNILSPNLTNWQTEWVTQCEVARVAIRNWGHIYKVGWNNQEYSDRPTLRYFTREELFPRLFKSFQWNECSNTMKMNFEVCSLNKTRSWTQQYDNWLLPGLVLGDGGDNTKSCWGGRSVINSHHYDLSSRILNPEKLLHEIARNVLLSLLRVHIKIRP